MCHLPIHQKANSSGSEPWLPIRITERPCEIYAFLRSQPSLIQTEFPAVEPQQLIPTLQGMTTSTHGLVTLKRWRVPLAVIALVQRRSVWAIPEEHTKCGAFLCVTFFSFPGSHATPSRAPQRPGGEASAQRWR